MLDGAAGAAGSCAVNENRQNDERAKSNFSIRVFSSCVVVREYMPEVVPWGSFILWWEDVSITDSFPGLHDAVAQCVSPHLVMTLSDYGNRIMETA